MWIDLLAMFAVAFFTSAGYFRGFVSLLFAFFAVLAAYLGARHLALLLERMADWSGLAPELRFWVLIALSAIIIYLLVNLIGLLVAHFAVGKEEERRRTDRAWGMMLGVLQGVLIALFLACLVGGVPDQLREEWPWLEKQAEGSRLVALVEPYNPILHKRDEIRWIQQIGETIDLIGDPDQLADLELPERAREVIDLPEFRSLFKDSSLLKALKETDYSEVFSKDRWAEALNDPDLRRALEKISWDELRTDIEEAREQAREKTAEGLDAVPE